ncbi:MAG: type II toxin-antitoxin system VapC family toxin [Acetobacteraceae bacterium]|nr:type II toxin-antitoxin system VapC family toxin [Acetobacteraceae bacterium]
MTSVIDASVAVKWFLNENGSAEAAALLERRSPLLAPELILAETANVLWKTKRRGALLPSDKWAAFDGMPLYFARLVSLRELHSDAIALALAHDHPAYDCFYVALARREAAPLVTADAGLARRFSGVAEIRLLGG